jgi:hypothetical protein
MTLDPGMKRLTAENAETAELKTEKTQWRLKKTEKKQRN